MASAGVVMSRQQFSDLFESRLAYIDEIAFENFDAPSLTYPLVFNVRSSGRGYEEMTGVTGFGLFGEKDADGGVIDYDQLLQAYDKRFTHLTYGKGFAITKEAMADDIDGIITQAAPALGRAAQVSIETVIWNVFNNGFTTETTADGVSLWNASHPLVGGGTQSNLLTGDLAVASLEAAINLFDSNVDDRSLKIETRPSTLLIPTQLRWVAHEILRSQLRSDTANNTANAFNQIGMDIIESKYLTGQTDWFVGMPKEQTRLMVYWREEPTTDHTMDFDTGNMKTKMTYRMSVGAYDYLGWVANQGS